MVDTTAALTGSSRNLLGLEENPLGDAFEVEESRDTRLSTRLSKRISLNGTGTVVDDFETPEAANDSDVSEPVEFMVAASDGDGVEPAQPLSEVSDFQADTPTSFRADTPTPKTPNDSPAPIIDGPV